MEFSNRNVQPQTATHSTQPAATTSSGNGKKSRSSDNGKWGRWGIMAAVIAVFILLVGTIIFVATNNNIKSQQTYVNTSKLQAVFLNTGQVYFGNIQSTNSQYFVLTNIYYLQTANSGSTTSTTAANSNVSLIKLGCELHSPYDQMVINTSQITFWENLQANGKVAQAVAAFQKQNPNGQQCSTQSTGSASTNSIQNTQPATKP